MDSKIFHTILNAIQLGKPESLEFPHLDRKESASIVEGLFDARNRLKRYRFRVHLSVHLATPDCYLRIVMPSFLHETAGGWLIEQHGRWMARGLISEVDDRAILKLPSPTITNFTGNYDRSVKEPDFAFIPIGSNRLRRDFPSVVLESGWSSTASELADQCRLWHEGSRGRVGVVILVKLYPANSQNKVRATLSISRAAPPGTIGMITHQHVFPIPNPTPPDPTLTMEELFGGQCPPGLYPDTLLTLEVASLRRIVEVNLISDGYLPA